jgi:hypothetical protein
MSPVNLYRLNCINNLIGLIDPIEEKHLFALAQFDFLTFRQVRLMLLVVGRQWFVDLTISASCLHTSYDSLKPRPFRRLQGHSRDSVQL